MGFQVILEQLVLGESESTDWANLTRPPAVDLLVSPQCSGSREALATDVAAVRFNSAVTPHVRLHVLEPLPTDVTRLAATTDVCFVRSEMVEQIIGGLVVFTTDATEALRVVQVGFHVFH